MAKVKPAPKKKDAKKKEVKKTAPTKEAKVASKETKVEKPNVKSKTNAKQKDHVKSETKKKEENRAASHKKSFDKLWKTVSFILVGIVLILLALILMTVLKNDSRDNHGMSNGMNGMNQMNDLDEDGVKLLVVYDPNCNNCDESLFISQVRENLIPDLKVDMILTDSTKGQEIVNSFGLKFAPLYLFSSDIANRSDWSNLESSFIRTDLLDEVYYVLNPRFVANKILIEDPIITSDAVVVGNPNATVTIIEFSDYDCPFCAVAEGNEELVGQFSLQDPNYEPPVPKIFENYVEKGLVKFVFYNFPIENIHPNSKYAHYAAICAGEQGSWLEYHNKLFKSRSEWIDLGKDERIQLYSNYSDDLGLDSEVFAECLETEKPALQVTSEINLALIYGVSGTPAFFVNRNFVGGALDYSFFEELIDSELNLSEE